MYPDVWGQDRDGHGGRKEQAACQTKKKTLSPQVKILSTRARHADDYYLNGRGPLFLF